MQSLHTLRVKQSLTYNRAKNFKWLFRKSEQIEVVKELTKWIIHTYKGAEHSSLEAFHADVQSGACP